MSQPGSNRLASLDGWRAIAILIVLASHCAYSHGWPEQWTPLSRWFPDGQFGVDIFFVISGFLITFLLLKEREKTGSVNLWGFYIRRTLRIVPAYIAFLCVIALLDSSDALNLGTAAWIHLCTYTVNYASYLPWTVGHIWTLSVEEQFYLLWPAVFILASSSRRPARAMAISLTLPLVLCPVFRVIGYVRPSLVFGAHSFLLRADALAVGCLSAVLLFRRRESVTDILSRYFNVLFGTALVLIVLPHVLMRLFLLGPLTVPLGPTLSAVGIAIVMLQSVIFPNARLFAWLQWKPLVHLGVLSYSVYLWQQVFSTKPEVFGLSSAPWFLSFPYWLVPTFAAALASYCLVERPFLLLKSRLQGDASRPAPTSQAS